MYNFLGPPCIYQIQSLSTPVTKIWKAVQNVENGVVRGQSRSWAVSSFNTVHMISYLTLIGTTCINLSCTVSEMQTLHTLAAFGTPLGWSQWNFGEIFGMRWYGLSYGVVCLCLEVLTQYRLVINRRTDRHMMTANTVLAPHCMVPWANQSPILKWHLNQFRCF